MITIINYGAGKPGIYPETESVSVPVTAAGGAKSIAGFFSAVSKGDASAVAPGSMFVFHGPHRAVLISYPSQNLFVEQLYKKVA